MDQLAREDITAAAAAHRELGPDYDGAVAEGLIERIGAEIDKRVDARLGQRGDGPAPPRDWQAERRDRHEEHRDRQAERHARKAELHERMAERGELRPAANVSWPVAFIAVTSMIIGAITSAVVLSGDGSGGAVAGLIWVIIGIINVAYARRR